MKSPREAPGFADLAAQALKSEETPAGSSSLGDRAADVAASERALRARARRRFRPWLVVAGGVAAAAGVLLIIGWQGPRPAPLAGKEPVDHALRSPSSALIVAALDGAGASVEVNGSERAAAVRDPIAPGARLRVAGIGALTLALGTGTRLRATGGSSLRVAELGALERFDLEGGTLAAEVSKLGPGRRFVIATPDAEVEVRGTRFEVAVGSEPSSCEPRVRTRVTVQEGVVVVRHGAGEARLVAGSHWPQCEPARDPGPRARRASLSPSSARRPMAAAAPAPPEAARAAEALRTSTLAEQNDLFAAALAARGRGDVQGALHWLDQLIARYPHGQLIDSARAQRARLVVVGPGREPAE